MFSRSHMRSPADLTVISRKGKDALILRGHMDSLVRRATGDGHIQQKLRASSQFFVPFLDSDKTVYERIEENLNLNHLMKGSVVVEAEFCGSSGQTFWARANGAIISKLHVLTVRHLFDSEDGHTLKSVNVFSSNGTRRSASVKEIPVEIMRDLNERAKNTNTGFIIGFIDIAILELQECFDDSEVSIFRLPSSDFSYKAMEPIALSGYPGDQNEILGSGLPRRLVPEITSQEIIRRYGLSDEAIDNIVINSMKESFGNGDDQIFAFGATSANSDSTITSYIVATYSTINGLSGAPIVCLRDPGMLIGINCGCFTEIIGSFYLATNSLVAKQIWRWLGIQL